MNNYDSMHTGQKIDTNITSVDAIKSKLDKMDVYIGTIFKDNWEWEPLDSVMLAKLATYRNKFYYEFFPEVAVNSGSYNSLKNAIPRIDLLPRYGDVHGSATGNQFNLHNYTCRATTYLIANEVKNVSFRWATDDEGAAFLNGTCLGTNTSCQWSTAQTISLKKGCNEIAIIWHEASGGEWMTTDSLSAIRGADIIQTGIPINSYRQVITPTNLTGTAACTTNTVLFGPSILNSNFITLEDVSKLLNSSTAVCETNGQITIKTYANPTLNNDITVYWLGYLSS